MIRNAVIQDAKLSFVMGFRMGGDFEDLWVDARGDCAAGYRWVTDERGTPETVESGHGESSTLDEFQAVEDFYLNARSRLLIGDERLKIERCIPDFSVRIRHHVGDRKLLDTPVDVVFTYYRTVDVLTVTLSIQAGDINANDLIYLKSLKWDSRDGLSESRTIDVSWDYSEASEPTWDQANFDSLFEQVYNRFFEPEASTLYNLKRKIRHGFSFTINDSDSGVSKYDAETNGSVILDTVSFRGIRWEQSSTPEIDFREPEHREPTKQTWAEDAILYGIVTGDEGYDLNTCETINTVVSDRHSKLDTRWYFDYFFSGTSVIADLSEEYDTEKKEFKAKYVDQYGSYPPYDEYLDLDTRIAALEDGMFLFGEIALVRYELLMHIDEQLEETLSVENDNMILPRGIDLRDLERVKRNSTTQLTRIDMLTESVLGLGAVPSFDEMFGYDATKEQVRERLNDLDDSIQYRYNRRIQRAIVVITLLTALVTLLANIDNLEQIVLLV